MYTCIVLMHAYIGDKLLKGVESVVEEKDFVVTR